MKSSSLKGTYIAGFIILLLVIDQTLKFFIKTHYYLGEEHFILGHWFRLHFVENEGMAWGLKFGGGFGKIVLTLFRLVAVIWGTFYLRKLIHKKAKTGYIICISLIYAGAAGNLIDSMFYGMIFNASDPYIQNIAHFLPKHGGYASFLHGRVVDMLYFPLVDTVLPKWIPIYGGKEFTFFDPVFNLADFYISFSFFVLIIFQRKFFPEKLDAKKEVNSSSESTTSLAE
ncbi:MAG TPA: lipoprotein signal peptidase [Arachidicoccus soli]|uniref:Lipoprotein signal peptidase n=1 Tax=Arachidicoccus soli TaxID=2341117 RepID=A0A386HMH4_9BACT|nr:lipoprotein signal peptidase [Arachidicoccus soli]AYD46816.1 lipoprotein signal peptidase [Arachidicoccus soli]HEU0228360.1 lipoprotein signal peptidase [Arachidicoccus soli]